MNPFQWNDTQSEAQYWNDPSIAADLQSRQSGVTEFAVEVEERFPRRARVLELGCSAGDDSAYFAERGHEVIGVDVSAPMIDLAAQRYDDHKNLEFRCADLTKPLGVGGQSLDAVYARLSLQYFDHATTLRVFSEIAWVIRPGGIFAFACRSTTDPLFGKGEEVEPNYFLLDGHYRHFFDAEYCSDLLEDNGFSGIEIHSGEQKLYGNHAAFVKCTAIAS